MAFCLLAYAELALAIYNELFFDTGFPFAEGLSAELDNYPFKLEVGAFTFIHFLNISNSSGRVLMWNEYSKVFKSTF